MFAKAAIALHNYLRTTESSLYFPPGFVDGEDGAGNTVEGSWREEEEPTGLIPLSHIGSNRFEIDHITFKHYLCMSLFNPRHSRLAVEIRDAFKTYFNSDEGRVYWQYDHVTRTS